MRQQDFKRDIDIDFGTVIIGGGFAGLSAAETLKDSPLINDILLLEGRGQFGGRASDGPNGARGAELVYSQAVVDLARRHDLHVEMLPDEWKGSHFLDADGTFCTTDSLGLFSGNHPHEILQKMKADMRAERDNISVDALLSAGRSNTYNGLEPREKAFIKRLIEGEYAADLASIGIASFQPNSDTFNADIVGRIPNGGYGALAKRMALDLRRRGVRQRCNAIVESVSNVGDPFHIRIRGEQKLFTARSVVMAVPSAVIQKGNIALPCAVPDALENIGRGNACKVLCTFDTPPWPKDFHFAYSMRAPFCYAWPRSEGTQHTLTLYISGNDAEKFHKTLAQPGGRNTAIMQIRQGVEAMFGDAHQSLRNENISMAPWILMPQSGMCYGFIKADNKRMDGEPQRNFLTTTIPEFVLAGEAYANSTVDGAICSGMEAALHIRRLFAERAH